MSLSGVKQGDILFFVSSGSIFDKLISWWTHSRFVHVAIAIGNGEKVEALGQGIVKDAVTSATAAVWHNPKPYDDERLQEALQWLLKQVGKPYGWGDIANAVDASHTFYYVQTGHVDCSALATDFLILAGYDMGELALDPHTVTPAALATFLQVH